MVRPRGRCTGADRPPGFLSFLQGDRATLAGMRKMRKGDKMSRDEYNALKRKVGGTYDGFIGEWVDVKGKYIEDGYVEEGGGFNWVNLLYIPVIGGLGVGIVLTLQAIN